MASTLDSRLVRAVLERLHALGEAEDAPAKERVRSLAAARGAAVYGRERAELAAAAPLAVTPAVGAALYALVVACRPRLVVEFGASLGASTVYLASALSDLGGGGRVITTELLASKAAVAASHLEAAGLSGVVEVRVGDARETLSSLPGPVDFLFLDGSNDLYIPLLGQLEPFLGPGAVVVADMSAGDAHHDRYREYVAARFVTVELPLDAGVVVSTPAS
jgi:predicted O-methyltransferase YrrM